MTSEDEASERIPPEGSKRGGGGGDSEEVEEDYDPSEEDEEGEALESRAPKGPKKHSDSSRRVWSTADELVVLQGLVDFSARKKENPVYDWNDIYQFIRSKLCFFVTKPQLQAKVSRLKQRHLNSGKKRGKKKKKQDLKPHELAAYELSRQLWADEAESLSERSEAWSDSWVLSEMSRFCGNRVDDMFLRRGWELVGDERKAHLADMGRDLWRDLLDLYVKHFDLIGKGIQLIVGGKGEFSETNAKDYVDYPLENRQKQSFASLETWLLADIAQFCGDRVDKEFIKKGLEVFDDEVKVKMDERCWDLLTDRLAFRAKHAELIREGVQLILDAYKQNGC